MNFNAYIKDNLDLVKSLVIKSQYSYLARKLEFEQKTQLKEVVRDNRYLKHLLGEYHVLDVVMEARSKDTSEIIVLDKKVLLNHPLTVKALRKQDDYFLDLCKKYPTQINLLVGLSLDLTEGAVLNAKEGDILYVNLDLVEEQEMSLLPALQEHIYKIISRWDVEDFNKTEVFYTSARYNILFLECVNFIVSHREKKKFTHEAHSYHLNTFIESKRQLKGSSEYLNRWQKNKLIENYNFMNVNLGINQVFETLYDILLEPKGLELVRVKYKQELDISNLEKTSRLDALIDEKTLVSLYRDKVLDSNVYYSNEYSRFKEEIKHSPRHEESSRIWVMVNKEGDNGHKQEYLDFVLETWLTNSFLGEVNFDIDFMGKRISHLEAAYIFLYLKHGPIKISSYITTDSLLAIKPDTLSLGSYVKQEYFNVEALEFLMKDFPTLSNKVGVEDYKKYLDLSFLYKNKFKRQMSLFDDRRIYREFDILYQHLNRKVDIINPNFEYEVVDLKEVEERFDIRNEDKEILLNELLFKATGVDFKDLLQEDDKIKDKILKVIENFVSYKTLILPKEIKTRSFEVEATSSSVFIEENSIGAYNILEGIITPSIVHDLLKKHEYNIIRDINQMMSKLLLGVKL